LIGFLSRRICTIMAAQKVTVMKIQGQSEWKCLRTKTGEWVAVCDPLALTIQADTWAELMEDIAQTLNMMLIDLLKENAFDKFMRDRGWTLVGKVPHPSSDVRFDVPFTTRLSERERDRALAVH